eukprot:m51a1_g7613 hypothetical protein (859) ;mRNA; f:271080-273775
MSILPEDDSFEWRVASAVNGARSLRRTPSASPSRNRQRSLAALSASLARLVAPLSAAAASLVFLRALAFALLALWQLGRLFAALPASADAVVGMTSSLLLGVSPEAPGCAAPAVALAAVDVAMGVAGAALVATRVVGATVGPSGAVHPALRRLRDLAACWCALSALVVLLQVAAVAVAGLSVLLRRLGDDPLSMPLIESRTAEQQALEARRRAARRRVVVALALLCAAAALALAVPPLVSLVLTVVDVAGESAERCEGLCADCALPWPSSAFVATLGGAQHVRLPRGVFRGLRDRSQLDPWAINELDGFSVSGPLLFDLDSAQTLAFDASGSQSTMPHLVPGRPFAPNCTAVIDVATGELVPHWAEVDGDPDGSRPLVVIQPAVPLGYGRRYVVAVRGMVDMATGLAAPRADGYQDALDGKDRPRLRQLTADVFPYVKGALGWDPADMQIAWDFPTMSEERALGRLRLMRDDLRRGPLSYSITRVETASCETPGNLLAKTIWATARVPSYLRGYGSTFRARPGAQNVTRTGTQSVEFVVEVPCTTLRAGRPALVMQYGHEAFGDCSEVQRHRELAAQGGWITVAADWQGLSRFDAPRFVRAVLSDPSSLVAVAENVMQGFLNADAVLQIVRTTFAQDPAVQAGGRSLVSPDKSGFLGSSFGAVLGGGYLGIARHERAVLGVPGAPLSLALVRSKRFGRWSSLLGLEFGSRRDVRVAMAMFQALWDPAEAAGWLAAVRGSGKQVLLQSAIDDPEVSEHACHLMARGYGAASVSPGNRAVFGVEERAASFAGSAVAEWKYHDVPAVPLNRPPPSSGRNPHHCPLREPEAVRQAASFLATGIVMQYCNSTCSRPAACSATR